MLARREPVSLRSLVAGSGVSTMAVYTYFDGMPRPVGSGPVRKDSGGWRIGWNRWHAIEDPVRHLALLGVAYVDNALSNPNLYRVMFDATFDLPDPHEAAVTFERLVCSCGRCIDEGRFGPKARTARHRCFDVWDPARHGVVSLAVTGVLAVADLQRHAPALATALFVDAGDSPERAPSLRSVSLE